MRYWNKYDVMVPHLAFVFFRSVLVLLYHGDVGMVGKLLGDVSNVRYFTF